SKMLARSNGFVTVSASLDDDLADHAWMHRTVVLEGAGQFERVAERFIRVERRRLEDLRCTHHRVWDVVTIGPRHSRPGGDLDGNDTKLKVVDRNGDGLRPFVALD